MYTVGNKGDKGQGKFKAIDINNLYKGTSVTPQKPTPVSSRQHGLQSLGKVANLRRMPPPANLPSLKSENSGVVETSTTSVNNSGWTKEDVITDDATSPDTTQLKSLTSLQTSMQLQEHGVTQIPDGSQNRSLLSVASGSVSWSHITSGGRRPGSFLDQKSVMFQEEFPQLAVGSEEKNVIPRKEDENKEASHGLGLNLRPQNEGIGKDGGGRSSVQPLASSEDHMLQASSQPLVSDDVQDGAKPSNVQTPGQFHGPVQVIPVRPGMPPPPPHLGQMPLLPPNFRPMMVPFGFRPGFPPNYPPNFLPPGMARPPFIGPADLRFQGMYPLQGWNYSCGPGPGPAASGAGEETASERPAIVKDKDLEDFDRLAISDDGWARSTVDVDYSERLVFSDEEDVVLAAKSDEVTNEGQSADGSHHERRGDQDKDDGQRIWKEVPDAQRTAGQDKQNRRTWLSDVPPSDARPSFIQPPFALQRPPMRPPLTSDLQTNNSELDEEELWRQRRKLQCESMSAAIERARQRREEEERRIKAEQTAAAREKLRQLDEKLGRKDEKVSSTRGQQQAPKCCAQYASVDVSETGPRGQLASPPSGSTSPRPLQQIPSRLPAPPRVSAPGFWSCDPRAWSSMPLPPRYIMDQHVFMIPSRNPVPGMALRMPARQSSVTDQGAEGNNSSLDLPEQLPVRGPWHDQTPFGIYSHAPIGSYERHVVGATGPLGFCGLQVEDYENVEDNGESTQQLLPGRRSSHDGCQELSDVETADLSAYQAISLTWADQPQQRLVEGDGEDDTRGKVKLCLKESGQSMKNSLVSSAKEMKDFGNSEFLGSTSTMAGVDIDRNTGGLEDEKELVSRHIREIELSYDTDHNRKKKDNSSQKLVHDERHAWQSSASCGTAAAALKRTHSSASNSSGASNERKMDSPRDLKMLERFGGKDSAEVQSEKSVSQEVIRRSWQTVAQVLESDLSKKENKTNLSDLSLALADKRGKENSATVGEVSEREDIKTEDTLLHPSFDRPPAKRVKNGGRAFRRRKESEDNDRARVSVSSREFVRGGRTRMRGLGHGRDRGYHDELDSPTNSKSFRTGFRGSEEDNNHDVDCASKEGYTRRSLEDKKKVTVSQAQAACEEVDHFSSAPVAGRNQETVRNRGVVRPQSQRSEPRASQKSELTFIHKKEASEYFQKDVTSRQLGISDQKTEPILLSVKKDQQNIKTDMQTTSVTRINQRPRNSSGRSRRNNRQHDRLRQSTANEDLSDPITGDNTAQLRVEADKCEMEAPAGSALHGAVCISESVDDGLAAKRTSGSHRRRRPRPSWSKGSATSTVAVKSAAGVVVSTDCGLGSELK